MTNEEINRKVAEDVMGWNCKDFDNLTDVNCSGIICETDSEIECFDPAADIADAWEVVERLKGKYYFVINTNQGGNYDAGFQEKYKHKHPPMIFNEESESMAICLAALKATEVK